MCYHYLYPDLSLKDFDLYNLTFPVVNSSTGEVAGEYNWNGDEQKEVIEKLLQKCNKNY